MRGVGDRRRARSGEVHSPYEDLLRSFFAARRTDLDSQAVVFNLYRTATDVIASMEAEALQPHGLTHAGFVLLMTLWISGPREVRELAQVQRVSRPAIVGVVGTLERAKLVRRVRSEVDRRLVRVELQPGGRRLIRRVQSSQHRFERAVGAVLSRQEQRQLCCLLRRVGGVVGPKDDPPRIAVNGRGRTRRRVR